MMIFAAALALMATSCSEEPPPDGYELRMRFVSTDPAVFQNLRVQFEPEGDQRFMMVEPMDYAGGAIDLQVEADGVLVMTIDGAYVSANSTPDGTGAFLFPLEIWTGDLQPRSTPPGVRVVATRADEAIAEGFRFLPEWPLPLGEGIQFPVNCRADAANRGLCTN
ncbi:MAG: hypothetical protein AB8I08_00795 [Sandaracinaceae bacterium]